MRWPIQASDNTYKEQALEQPPVIMVVADPGVTIGAIAPLKPTKVSLFTMMLYNSENNVSKPIPNKSFVMFKLSHCSRYKAILSFIVASQQFCGLYFIYPTVAKPLWDLTTKYYWNRPPPTLLAGPTPDLWR